MPMLLILARLSPAPVLCQDAAIRACLASMDHGQGELSWQRRRQTAPRASRSRGGITCCSRSRSRGWATLPTGQPVLQVGESLRPLCSLCLACCPLGGRAVLWWVAFCSRKDRSEVLSLLQSSGAGGATFWSSPSCVIGTAAGSDAWWWGDFSPLPDNLVTVGHRPLLPGYGKLLGS